MGFKVCAILKDSFGNKHTDYLSRNWENEPAVGLFGSPICQYSFGATENEATVFASKKEAEQAVEIRNQTWGKKNPIISLELIET